MNRFENGFHSFKKSIASLTKNSVDEFDLKEIVINFHHSIEVLFKYILFNKNSLFLYNDIDKLIECNFNIKAGIIRNHEEKNNVEPYTINFDETIKRVIVICDVSIDKYTYNRLKNLNKFRNSLIHDELDLIKEEVEQLIISILPTVIMILHKYLPSENEKEFIKFIEDEEITEKLNNLYIYNDRWKIITIINLLTTYKSIDCYKTSMIDKNHMNKIISILGCEIMEDEFGISIDGAYYLSTISYLKQELCDYIVFQSKIMKEFRSDDKMKELLEKNEVVEDVCKEYIYNMICYLAELINIDRNELIKLIDDEESVKRYMDNQSLIGKVDIYEVLFYITKTAQSFAEICDNKKRREVFLKEILLNEDEKLLNAFSIYSSFIKWFNVAKWYNNTNFKDMSKDVMNTFIEGSFLNSEISDEVSSEIYSDDCFNDLLGSFGEWSSIDYIDQHHINGIDIIIQDINNSTEYTLILDVSVSVQTYSDHDYYNNGTEETYVAVIGGLSKDNKFSIDSVRYLGRKRVLKSFGFK